MDRFSCLLYFILIISLKVQSQNNAFKNDSVAVHKTILTLFDGMREGDSAKVKNVFTDQVRMFTSLTSDTGKKILKEGDLNEFLKAVGTAHENIWDERLYDMVIQIDGNLAQVWTNYVFYIGKNLSHCGVNAFQLVKDGSNDWKIIHLIDTRRKGNCGFNND